MESIIEQNLNLTMFINQGVKTIVSSRYLPF